jgi:S1-C subfamily serine protease
MAIMFCYNCSVDTEFVKNGKKFCCNVCGLSESAGKRSRNTERKNPSQANYEQNAQKQELAFCAACNRITQQEIKSGRLWCANCGRDESAAKSFSNLNKQQTTESLNDFKGAIKNIPAKDVVLIFIAVLVFIELSFHLGLLPNTVTTPLNFVRNKLYLPETKFLSEPIISPPDDNVLGAAKVSNKLQENGTGTAFYYQSDGTMLTNHHVVSECDQIRIINRSSEFIATVIKTDPSSDLALLKIDTGVDTVHKHVFFELREPEPNEGIVIFGFPLGSEISLTGAFGQGIVSSVQINNSPSIFQISAPVQGGNSGSAIVGGDGKLVGIVFSGINESYFIAKHGQLPQSINFGVKASKIKDFLDDKESMESDNYLKFFRRIISLNKVDTKTKLMMLSRKVKCFKTLTKNNTYQGDEQKAEGIQARDKTNDVGKENSSPQTSAPLIERTALSLTKVEPTVLPDILHFFVRNNGNQPVYKIYIGYVFSKHGRSGCSNNARDYDGVVAVYDIIEPSITKKIMSIEIPKDAEYFCVLNY